ncbi:MAG: hypothetical protein P8Y69_09180 [Gammaproteobacteria bacterium]
MTKLPLCSSAAVFAALMGFCTQANALEACSATTGSDEPCIGPPAGELRFDNSDVKNAKYELVDTSGTTTATQPVFAVDCDLSYDAETLVAFEPGAGFYQTIGFNAEGSRGGCGQPAGQVEAGQEIEWRLTGALTGQVSIKSSMTMEFKNATGDPVWGELRSYIGEELTGTIQFRSGPVLFDPTDPGISSLRNGRTATQSPMVVVSDSSYCYDTDGVPIGLMPATGGCAAAEPTGIVPDDIDFVNFSGFVDSGPDRQEGDDGKLVFNNRANRWVLHVFSGAVGISGGKDFRSFADQTVHYLADLFDGQLFCSQTTITATNPSNGADAVFTRLPNDLANEPEGSLCGACSEVLYNLEWSGDTLEFTSPLIGSDGSDQSCAAFQFEIRYPPSAVTFRPVDDPTTPEDERAVPVDPTLPDSGFQGTATAALDLAAIQQFDFLNDGEYFIDLCEGTKIYKDVNDVGPYAFYDTTGFATGEYIAQAPAGAPGPNAFADLSGDPGLQHACWWDQEFKYDPASDGSSDVIQLILRGWKRGDWGSRVLQ